MTAVANSAPSAPVQREARPRRHLCLDVQIVGLLHVEREYLQSIIAVFCDPQLKHMRERLVRGEMAPVIESGEVTWVDADQLGDELRHRLEEEAR